MLIGPLKWYTIAEAIRQGVDAELTQSVDRSGVVPGAIAWDECDCGLLAVSLAQVYPSESFPDPLVDVASNCAPPYEVGEYIIQVIRCMPQPEGQNFAPSVAALQTAAQELLIDAYDMIRGARSILCEMDDAGDISDFLLRPLTSQGPSGACGGNELRVLVNLIHD